MMDSPKDPDLHSPLDRRALAISALAGLLVGLGMAWYLWKTIPAPANQTPLVEIAPTAAPIGAPAPAAPKQVVDDPLETSQESQLPAVEIDVKKATEVDGRLVIELDGDRDVTLTVVPAIQKRAAQILKKAEVPYGALVAMEPATGRILGFVEHSSANPTLQHLAGRANPPAASIFKLVTTTALLETTRVTPDFKTCFNGGSRGISKRHLEDDPRRDSTCQTLTEALAKSTNAIFGKLADRHLSADVLQRYARAYGWDREIPFLFPVEQSRASFGTDRVELARTAAGFYNTQLSPIHGALVAAAIANNGRMMAPGIVDHYVANGRVLVEHTPVPMGRVCRENTARILAKMMVETTTNGTAGPYFRKRSKSLRGIDVAAKTGSLSAMADNGERHHFSWWVGFAPANNPRIALAALVVNVGKWKIKSSYLARETLEIYFKSIMKGEVTGR